MSTAKAAKSNSSFGYQCLTAKQGKFELVAFFAPAKELWKCVSVNEKKEDEDGGYQRATSASRLAAIAKFIDGNNPIPTSILISLKNGAVTISNGKIEITAKKASGWVIDGQHRLSAAAENAKKEITLPVIAFIGLSVDDQINQFVTINREARGVPTSLYYSLLKKLPPKMKPAELAKERAADIGQQLKQDDEGPFGGKIVSTTSPKSGQLSLTNFVRKVSPLVAEERLLAPFTAEEQVKIVANYYTAVRNVFPKAFDKVDSVFFQTVGFGALFNFFPLLFNTCLSETGTFTAANATKLLKRLDHIDVETWRKGGSGNAAELQLGNDLKEEFRSLTTATASTSGAIKLD
ncbi:MAG: hypothetical protein JWN73_186 [Betaproteobacteria bacterium]|nr:hypothetical protein [Betaproteobacteria bacterium]